MEILSMKNKLSLSLLLDQITFAAMVVLFFPHIRSLNGSQLYQGAIMSVASLVGLFWNPIVGSLGDTYGRKFILKRLYMTSAIANSLMVISNSLVIIFISRFLAAFAPIGPVLSTAASQYLKEDQASYFNRMPAIMSISFIVGSLVGGYLLEFNGGCYFCFFAMATINLINVGIVSTLPDQKEKTDEKKESLPLQQMAQKEIMKVVTKLTSVNWKEYSDIFSVKLCFELGCGLFYRSVGPTFMDYGIEGRAMGYVFTFMSIATIVANIVLIKLKGTIYSEDKFGNKRLFHAATIFVLTALILGFSNNALFFALGMVPMAVARTIADSTFTEALMAKASDKDKGGVTGAFESIVSMVGLFTPLVAGLLTDWYGMKFTLQLALIPTILGVILTYGRV